MHTKKLAFLAQGRWTEQGVQSGVYLRPAVAGALEVLAVYEGGEAVPKPAWARVDCTTLDLYRPVTGDLAIATAEQALALVVPLGIDCR